MTDTVENLILEHLKRFQAGQDRIEHKLDEHSRRLSNIEQSLATVIQHLGHLAAADASQQLTSDELGTRLKRIEARLEIAV